MITSDLEWRFDQQLEPQTEIGKGAAFVVSGYCYSDDQIINRLSVKLNDQSYLVQNTCDLRADLIDKTVTDQDLNRIYSGLWTVISVNDEWRDEDAELVLTADFKNGDELRIPIGRTKFVEIKSNNSIEVSLPTDASPLIAICLCTYEPELDTFERQINSILKQTRQNWVCLVNDDCSNPGLANRIQEICDQDERIQFARNDDNLGFYKNFEQCLRRVPENAGYVALSDQDDYWYPDKLERLLKEFDIDTALVYSDMRILREGGEVVSPSYWLNRKNEYKDIAVLLVANTVTGAASLFKRELLDYVLPFPTRVGDAFHDHWIACVALSHARIKYIDEPLYDYYQHGESVIGHCDFVPWPMWKRVWSFLNVIRRLCIPNHAVALLTQLRSGSLGVYYYECRRLELIVETLRLRGLLNARNKKALGLFGHGLLSGIRLLVLHVKVLLQRKTTDDAELRLALGYFVKWFEDKRIMRQKRKQFKRPVADIPVT